MSQHDLQLVLGTSPQWRLCFDANGDRHDSRLELVHDSRSVIVLTSPATDEPADWPPAPPIQECRRHSEQPNVLLATGAAGKAHWSASIEANEETGTILWDVACRTSSEPQRIGTEWIVGGDWSAEDLGDHIVIQNEEQMQLVICAEEGSSIRLIQAADHVRISIRPPEVHVTLPHTFRWKYGIRRDA